MSNNTPSAAQIRAAIGLLGWDNKGLAAAADVTPDTVSNITTGSTRSPHARVLDKIRRAFEARNIEFLPGDGLRRRRADIQVLEGREGFARFHDIVFAHLKETGGNACVFGSSAAQFAKYRSDGDMHRARMGELAEQRGSRIMRILAADGDSYMPNTAYATYRWMPRENFPPAAFYSFGDYLATLSFESDNAPIIILSKSTDMADTYNRLFEFAWENAKPTPEKRPRDA